MKELPVILNARNVAEVLGVTRRTAQRWIRAGQCGAYSELGGVLRVRRAEFLKALARQERRPVTRRPRR